MIPEPYLQSLQGGAIIGLATALLLLLNGRIAGVSGIFARALSFRGPELSPNLAFVVGLVLGPLLYSVVYGTWPAAEFRMPLLFMALAGVLVGYGTRLGNGCTSGHGVVGLARLSPRSITAAATFLTSGVVTVLIMRLLEML
ncbi:MAG: YeeE/YedE family protein [Alphaproteobacteria bacterium]|nr:YeeE/YedE family protein [Alphaproteobacteria bacterium]